MGASASVQDGIIPSDIAEMYNALDKIKDDIAAADVKVIQKESSKLIKSHTSIIKTMTKSTKSQLRRFVGPLVNAEDIEHFVGGQYGKFLSLVSSPKEKICERIVELATKGIGCDHNALIAGICILKGREIKKLSLELERNCGQSLSQIVSGNTKKRSAMQLFLEIISAGGRDDSDRTDESLADKQAAIINDCTVQSVEALINTICDISRAQCRLIDASCRRLYGSSIEDLVNAKLSGSIAKAIIAWTLPWQDAFCNVWKDNSDMTSICVKMKDISGKSLKDMISSSMSGKLRTAVISWVETPTLDGGFEERLEEYINSKLATGTSLVDILRQQDCAVEVKRLLSSQIDCYNSNGVSVSKPVLPGITQGIVERHIKQSENTIVASSSAPKKAETNSTSCHSLPKIAISTSPQSSRQSIHMLESPRLSKHFASAHYRQSERFEDAKVVEDDMKKTIGLAEEYIRRVYLKHDSNKVGSLPTDIFWKFVSDLELEKMGYTADEMESLPVWCDWSIDGYVSLDDAIHELTDLIINGLENLDLNASIELQTRIASISDPNDSSRVITPRPVEESTEARNPADALPPNLFQYVWDTFDAYDIRREGSLDPTEFWELITAMNFGFTDSDIECLQKQWDLNQDGYIVWEEAVTPLVDLILSMTSSDRDHWIGLVDRSTQALFWYNLRDSSSQWMSEEDQLAYSAGALNRSKTLFVEAYPTTAAMPETQTTDIQ